MAYIGRENDVYYDTHLLFERMLIGFTISYIRTHKPIYYIFFFWGGAVSTFSEVTSLHILTD